MDTKWVSAKELLPYNLTRKQTYVFSLLQCICRHDLEPLSPNAKSFSHGMGCSMQQKLPSLHRGHNVKRNHSIALKLIFTTRAAAWSSDAFVRFF